MKNRLLVFVLLGMVATLGWANHGGTASGASVRQVGGTKEVGYSRIDAENLAAMMAEEDILLINVHVPYGGEIPGTDANIPFDRLDLIEAGIPDKDTPVVLYCRSGSMSAAASRGLVEAGYSNVIELIGGFNAWRAAGYELDYKE